MIVKSWKALEQLLVLWSKENLKCRVRLCFAHLFFPYTWEQYNSISTPEVSSPLGWLNSRSLTLKMKKEHKFHCLNAQRHVQLGRMDRILFVYKWANPGAKKGLSNVSGAECNQKFVPRFNFEPMYFRQWKLPAFYEDRKFWLWTVLFSDFHRQKHLLLRWFVPGCFLQCRGLKLQRATEYIRTSLSMSLFWFIQCIFICLLFMLCVNRGDRDEEMMQ